MAVDFTKLERETAHLIPKHPKYHTAGIGGASYGFVALVVYWLLDWAALPPILKWVLPIAAAYAVARYDSALAWKAYDDAFGEGLMQGVRDDA